MVCGGLGARTMRSCIIFVCACVPLQIKRLPQEQQAQVLRLREHYSQHSAFSKQAAEAEAYRNKRLVCLCPDVACFCLCPRGVSIRLV
jgi:hypothetical protein